MSIENSRIAWPGWETVGLIGRGSFGAVYEIQREIFDDVEKAALKVISIPQNASDIEEMYSDGFDEESITSTFKSYLKSIVAEYSLMRKMNGCTNIVNCDDVRYVQHDDGIGWDIFIKMELLTPLTKALPAGIAEETVIQIAKDICTALQLCKKHGIVHRDIKPQNIFVSPNGDYKLGDFGIAKTVEKTTGGTKIGTYKYMAPEVYHNKPYGSAADIYSLGLVLYWLLNERRMPFMPMPPAKLSAGGNEEARNRRLSGEQFPAPKNGSKALKAIVMKACAYNVEDRYASADEMLTDLNRLGQEEKAVMQMPVVPVLPKQAPVEDEDKTVAAFRRSDVQESATPAAPVVIKASVPVPAPTEANAVSESPKKSEAVPQVDNKEDTSPKPKQSKKKWPMILGAAAVLLIAVLAFLLPGGRDNGAGDPVWTPGTIKATDTHEEKVITIAASPTPHAEILNVAKDVLADEGWMLEIVEYTDYVVPNTVVDEGEIDANYFQYTPYLDAFNAENGTELVSIAAVHYETFGIYPGTKAAIADLADGDVVAIPKGEFNCSRALLLLAAENIITLKEGVGAEATVLDIVENPLDLVIVEMEAAQIAGVRDAVALAVINGYNALQAGLNATVDALATENAAIAATTYANILVVKAGNENTEKTQTLINALLSENVKSYITETYNGAVVPVF